MPARISKREEKRFEMPDAREDMVVVACLFAWFACLAGWGRWGRSLKLGYQQVLGRDLGRDRS